MVGQTEQNREDADVNIGEITHALPYHRLGVSRKVLAPLDEDEIERLLSADILANQRLDASNELSIVENRDLYLEDRRLFFASMSLGPLAYSCESLLSLLESGVKALDLTRYCLIRYDPMWDVGNFP